VDAVTGPDDRDSRPSLRERRRRHTATEISAVAAELFLRDGVATTTLADIAAAAEVSTRTVQRYFANKADVLAPVLREGLQDYLAAVASIPSRRHDLDELGAALVDALAVTFEGPDGAREAERVRLVVGEPELLSVWLRMHEECVHGLVPLLAPRLPVALDPLPLRFGATLVVTANRLAVETWAATGGDARDHLVHCLEALRTWSLPGTA